MCDLSNGMVEAAQANDWDRLVALEHEMADIRAELMRIAPDGRQAADLTEADAARKASLITAMLRNDEEIRRHVEPWLASTRKLLGSAQRDRAVRSAYGAFGP
uniref:Flagellar protein FliT n=2 Tax=Aromatoleum anaerobium TaxID=182180 RepID=A0ABX1PH57_9RHOO